MSGLYIKRFVDRLQTLEAQGTKDFVCPISDAKNLHNEITRLLVDLEALHKNTSSTLQHPGNTDIEIGGGTF